MRACVRACKRPRGCKLQQIIDPEFRRTNLMCIEFAHCSPQSIVVKSKRGVKFGWHYYKSIECCYCKTTEWKIENYRICWWWHGSRRSNKSTKVLYFSALLIALFAIYSYTYVSVFVHASVWMNTNAQSRLQLCRFHFYFYFCILVVFVWQFMHAGFQRSNTLNFEQYNRINYHAVNSSIQVRFFIVSIVWCQTLSTLYFLLHRPHFTSMCVFILLIFFPFVDYYPISIEINMQRLFWLFGAVNI